MPVCYTQNLGNVSCLLDASNIGDEGRCCAYAEVCFDACPNGAAKFNPQWPLKASASGVWYYDGWNCSFHDCCYNDSYLIALAPTFRQARQMLADVMAANGQVDDAVERYKRRNLVREGD